MGGGSEDSPLDRPSESATAVRTGWAKLATVDNQH